MCLLIEIQKSTLNARLKPKLSVEDDSLIVGLKNFTNCQCNYICQLQNLGDISITVTIADIYIAFNYNYFSTYSSLFLSSVRYTYRPSPDGSNTTDVSYYAKRDFDDSPI